MRRWMAFLIVLGALAAPSVPAALGQDGATYTSPTYGYVVAWDPAVWQALPDEALVADGPEELDRLRLENPAGSLYVEGSRRYDGVATRCSAEELALFTRSPSVADVAVRTDLAAAGPDRSIESAEGTLTLEGGESIRLAVYVDCRRLSPEATLVATLIAPAAVFPQVLPAAQAVVEAISVPDGAEPESDFFQALREVGAGAPAAGPLDGSLALAAGALETLAAGVDLADFAATATFANPYPAVDHPFDFGFGFRQTGGDDHLRLVVDSDGVWYLKDGLGPVLASGRVEGVRTGAGETNTVELIARGDGGGFAVNGVFVAELDLSARSGSGDLFVASGFFAEDALDGRSTGLDGFAVWSLAVVDGTVPVDEVTLAGVLAASRQAPPLAEPLAGILTQIEGVAALAPAGVNVADFVAGVRWANPESAYWDVGVAFRDQADGRHYRLTFDQTGGWAFGIGLEPKLATGGAATMRLGAGAVNTLELLVVGEQAAFSVNGSFVAVLDVSAIGEPGDVWFGSGFSAGNVTAGTEVRFRDLTVWNPVPASAPAPAAAGTPAADPGPPATPEAATPLPTAEVPPTVEPLPPVEPLPTAELLPTVEPPPTAEPLPTAEPPPTDAPQPTSAPLPQPPVLPTIPPLATPSPSAATGRATPGASARGIVVVRVGEVAGSGIQGLATVTEVAGEASVQLVVEGAAEGVTAAIHAGACNDLAAEPFVRLIAPDDIGRSRTLLDRPSADLLGGDLVLAVFAGGETAGELAACGPIGG